DGSAGRTGVVGRSGPTRARRFVWVDRRGANGGVACGRMGLGRRLAVGLGALDPATEVRSLPPQPYEWQGSVERRPTAEDAMSYDLKLFTGNANRPLAEEIAADLRVRLGDADVSRFSDGEVNVQINENVRGQDVFVVQPTCPPVNDNLMELLVMIDAFKRA